MSSDRAIDPAVGGRSCPALTLVGESADFDVAVGPASPRWEHVLLRADGSADILAVDRLVSASTNRLVCNKYFDLGQLGRLRARLKTGRFVLAQSEQSGYLAAAALFAHPDIRVSIIFHGHRWWTRRNRVYAAIARRSSSTRMLCLSSSLRDLAIDACGMPPDRVVTTGFGVDSEFFRPMPKMASARPCVVSAGTASRDYRTLVEAVRGLDVETRIAADSTWYREEVNVAFDALPDNVSMFSAGGFERLRALYAEASFVVVPLQDVRHACGYSVIAEAMAMGKAVIATRSGAPSDLVADGTTGLYVPANDVPAMRAAIERLAGDPALASRMGRAARQSIEREFNLEAYVARLRAAALRER